MVKVRVYELAKELGVDSKRVMRTLGDMGEFVRSASSLLEPPVVAKMRDVFRGGTGAAHATSSTNDDAIAEAARIFGVDAASLRTSKSRVRRPKTAAAAQLAPRTGIPRATDAYDRDWANRLIPPETRQAFIEAGLHRRSAAVVEQCRLQGISPDDLSRRVDGRRVADRLRGGEPVVSVAIRLREAASRSNASGDPTSKAAD